MLQHDSAARHHEPQPSRIYSRQLADAYPMLGPSVLNELTGPPLLASLPEQPGQYIPYIYAGQKQSGKAPLFVVPGYGEGILHKIPLAAELISYGYAVVLPGQNRDGMLHDEAGNPLATESQARNYAALLEAEGLQDMPVHFIAHSYGSLVLGSLVERILLYRPDYFKKSTVFLLAPAGLVPEPSKKERSLRWAASHLAEAVSDHDFPDKIQEVLLASGMNLKRNPRRSIAENRDMLAKLLDFTELCKHVGQVVIMAYAEDSMYPQTFLEPGIERAVLAGATALTPVSPRKLKDGTLRSGKSATHNDEQLNPSRVAAAIDQYLRLG